MRTILPVFLIAVYALATATAAADPLVNPKDSFASCHNVTGTCLHHGFVCANEEVVHHGKRCDGIEDCADGTDEFMCDHPLRSALHERSEEQRHAFEQASCVKCNCAVNKMTITQSNPWHKFAILAPVDFVGLATGAPTAYGGRQCNPKCVSSIQMTFYKKTGVCRGWLCCARQNQCITCNSGGVCPASNNPGYTKRCYSA